MTQMTDGTVPPTHPPHAPSVPASPDGSGTGTLRPLRPHAQLSRSQILDATEECLIDKGYDGTTIRRIAAALGCAVGSIYRYFTDKRELLDAVAQRRFRPVLEHVRGRQRVRRTATLYVQVATDQPEVYRLMFWLASIGRNSAGGAMPQIVSQIIEGWATQLGGQAEAELFWSRLHGRLMLGGAVEPILASVPGGPVEGPVVTVAPAPGAPVAADAGAAAKARATEDVTLL